MIRTGHLCWAGFLLPALAGCVFQIEEHPGKEPQTAHQPLETIFVRESGFGTFADMTRRDDPRARLKVRRVSRLDAYRNLAERVYGSVVYGGSTVDEFVLEDDRFRTYVDTYLRGARVMAVNEHSDGVIETVMELKLETRFRSCLAQVNPINVSELCPMELPGFGGPPLSPAVQGDRSAESLYYLDEH